MPLYTYACAEHGQFAEWASIGDSEAPCACPACTTPAPRALAQPALGGRGGSDGGAGDWGSDSGSESPSAGMGGCGCGAGSCMH